MNMFAAESVGQILPIGGGVTLLLALAGYLLREVNRSSAGAWRVVKEKNREIHRIRWERDWWQARAIGDANFPPYVEPRDDEL